MIPAETADGAKDVRMADIWSRMEGICRRLWEEDKSAAVPLQALAEEFRGEAERLETELEHSRKRRLALEAADLESRRRAEELAQKLESAQAESLRQREEFLKAEAEKEAQRAQRMQAFYDDLKKKSELLEQTWEQRRRDLDTDCAKRSEDLAGRESRCAQREAALKRQEDALAQRQKQLEDEFAARRAELDQLKERFQREIAVLVKQYGAKKG